MLALRSVLEQALQADPDLRRAVDALERAVFSHRGWDGPALRVPSGVVKAVQDDLEAAQPERVLTLQWVLRHIDADDASR